MSLNQIISKVALETANHYNGSTDLLDAIVELDERSIYYLIENKYVGAASKYGYTRNRIKPTSIKPIELLKALEIDMRNTSHIVVM